MHACTDGIILFDITNIQRKTGDVMDNLVYALPGRISDMLFRTPKEKLEQVNEIRLRINKPIVIRTVSGEYVLSEKGMCREGGEIFTAADAQAFLRRINEHSPYIHGESLCGGYITIRGGHRIGIGGEVICDDGKVRCITNQSSFCIRCAHQIKGCFEYVRETVFEGGICSCLFFSPPGGGKTTMLRDCCRVLSNEGRNVALVDERNEISACYMGVPSLDVGARCDVLSFCPRRTGILMAVRALAPQVIITDELGTAEDLRAVNTALDSGVTVIASVHAGSIEELRRKEYSRLLRFNRYVSLQRGERGPVYRAFDADFMPLGARRDRYCCI